MTTQASATALAQWIAINEPQFFRALQSVASRDGTLAGVSDWLSGVGTSITDAVKSVGSYLTSNQGMKNLTDMASTYFAGKTQQEILKTQAQLAIAGMAPAPITNAPAGTGGIVSVYTPTNQVVSPPLLQQLRPSMLQQYGFPLAIGGGVLLLLLILRR